MMGCGNVAVIYRQDVEKGRVLVVAFVGLTYIVLALWVREVERRAAARSAQAPGVVMFHRKRG